MEGRLRIGLEAASRESWDLAIVGGGVYGVAGALEASRRGLRTILFERGDFGGETTWQSLRIVHGGLRYLQSADLRRFRESVGERRWFFRHFPDLVDPLPCLMPLYGDGMKKPPILRLALAANDLLSSRRNAGVRTDRHLLEGRVIGADEVASTFGLVRREGLRGAALWYDGAMPDSQRLLLEMLRSACAAGAAARNYTEVTGVTTDNGRATGVVVRDGETGSQHAILAERVLNCAGPWSRSFASSVAREVPVLFRGSIAFNLLLDRPPVSRAAVAVAPPGPGARTYFVTGWKGRILAGTYHLPVAPGSTATPPTAAHVAGMLDDLNSAMPGFALTPAEVLRVHWGMLPAAAEGTDTLAVREVIHDHGPDGGPQGFFSVSGVKWTTARLVAEKVLRVIAPSRAVRPFVRAAGTPPPAWAEFRRLARSSPAQARAIVRRIVDEEGVRKPDDLLLRRTDWGALPGDAGEALSLVEPLLGATSR